MGDKNEIPRWARSGVGPKKKGEKRKGVENSKRMVDRGMKLHRKTIIWSKRKSVLTAVAENQYDSSAVYVELKNFLIYIVWYGQ